MIQPVKEKIILGIDPGTTIMGYGVLRVVGVKPEMIAMGIIDLRKFGDHYLKLRHIHEGGTEYHRESFRLVRARHRGPFLRKEMYSPVLKWGVRKA